MAKLMGFEQLASLRDELAQQAKAEKAAKRPPSKPQHTQKTPEKLDPVLAVISRLQKRFPHVFPKNPKPKVPLKIGIHKDLQEHLAEWGIDEKQLRAAIKTWCWGNRYWSCLTENAVRVDLEGNDAGQVSKEDADRAKRLKASRRHKSKTANVPVAVTEADTDQSTAE